MYLESPSKLAHEALNMKPEPGPIDEPFKCAFCGHNYDSGGYPYKPTAKFNNHADTYASKIMCQSCKVVTSGSTFILQNKCAVYSADGVCSLNKDIDLAAFLRIPPKPPFLAVYGTIKQQHLVWRTEVSNSEKLFTFRIGDYAYCVDRNTALKTEIAYREGLNSINRYREQLNHQDKGKRKPLPSFFAVPTSAIRSMNDTKAFAISYAVNQSLESAVKDAGSDNTELASSAKLALTKGHAAIELINECNYAEFFLALACSKYTDAEINEHAQKR